MFRDREEALEQLQEQLLEDEEIQEEEILEEEPEEDELPQSVYDSFQRNVRAYNADTAQVDLEQYSEAVYNAPRKKSGCVLWFVLLTAAVLLALSYFLAKRGGLL